MPLTAAEKQRKYRERLKMNDPDKYAAMKKKNAERTKSKKKKISECTEDEKKEKRDRWRAEKRSIRESKAGNEEEKQETKRQEMRIYQKVYRKNRKMQNTIDLQKKCIKKLQKQLNRYKAKCERLSHNIVVLDEQIEQLKQLNVQTNQVQQDLTPQTKADLYVQDNFPTIPDTEKQKVKKQLFEHNVLVHSLTLKYNNGSNYDKDILKSVVENDLVKKYKLKTKMASYLGLKGKIRHHHDNLKKKRSTLLKSLIAFYERDDISRATAGKKEVKTFKKEKRQRRYLLQPLRHLYKIYRSENGKLSFSTFKKYRPFHILPPKLSNRETCACIKHDNMEMKIKKLNSLGLTETKYTNDLLAEVMCDVKSKDCAYNDCVTCKNKIIEFKNYGDEMDNDINWTEWTLENLEYTNKDSKTVKTTRMIRKDITGSLNTLVQKFKHELIIFKKHCYNIMHQYRMYRKCLNTLDDKSVIVHIDFSENYGCKLSTEVQAMHFGASKVQVTLHTGLIYTKLKEPISFCTISPCNYHGPEAIWAHLEPILKLIKEEFSSVNGIHFFSDGPTSQYRQKKNFYLFEQVSKELGFPHSTWNFFEAAHGKGAADGIGGAIKRSLDAKVAYGENIPDAEAAFRLLNRSETKIKIFYLPEIEVIEKYNEIGELAPIPGTMNIHQIRNTPIKYTIAHRELSCFCEQNGDTPKGYCNCIVVSNHNLKAKKAGKRKISTEKQGKTKKKVKINKVQIENESDESDFSVKDSSEDESYEKWQENTIKDCISNNKPKITLPLLQVTKKTEGSWVVFKYDEKLYPGIILSVNEEGALIKAMKKSIRSWKWPQNPDVLLYAWDDILGSIEPPRQVSKRGLFSVPELEILEN